MCGLQVIPTECVSEYSFMRRKTFKKRQLCKTKRTSKINKKWREFYKKKEKKIYAFKCLEHEK